MKRQFLNYKLAFIIVMMLLTSRLTGCSNKTESEVIPGAGRTEIYLPMLKDKCVAVVANPTSLIGESHLVDSLQSSGIKLGKIFSPEHGFRGNADAGEKVSDYVDKASGLQVISLYGKHRKPSKEDLADIDVVVFDLQDVGVRFYTYLTTMHFVMEACAENGVPMIVLDRPNPNGFYIDGPMLKPEFSSFVGMHPVPVVYGMSIGEYARMINGEGWLKNKAKCSLKVIKCKNWDHNTQYDLPVKPSPNLPNHTSVVLYPSLCFFEGTVVSAGRGTDFPFQCFGHPGLKDFPFSYVPRSIPGACKYPKFKGEECKGLDLRVGEVQKIYDNRCMNLSYLLDAYNCFSANEKFFNGFFKKLAGTDQLQQQIQKGWSQDQIRESWQKDLDEFKETRKKYLLYPDFE